MLSIFRKIQTADRELNRIQEQIIAAVNPLVKSTVLNYVELKDIALTSTTVDIEHTLGRQPLGWIITDNQADARVWRAAWSDRFLSLTASGNTTISLLVY
jgi:hypothetical protein